MVGILNLFELLILGIIAVLLVYRLFNVLGQRTGFEQTPQDDKDNVVSIHPKEKPAPRAKKDKTEEEAIPTAIKPAIKKIKAQDPDFSFSQFIQGATKAFEMILEAYAKGDKQTLENMLHTKVFETFNRAIEERNKAKQTLETTLVRLESVDVTKAKLEKSVAEFVVKYVSEQTHILRDDKNKIVEGSPNQVEQAVDIWTFTRDLRTSNPNWMLIDTKG